MAGVHFSFDNILEVVSLNIGIADRLDTNRAENFTLLFCDFTGLEQTVIRSCLENVLRQSDAIANYQKHYFFILPYTDQYGATIVKGMFEEFFDSFIPSALASYPLNGEQPCELFESLQASAKKLHNINLDCFDAICPSPM